MRARKHHTKHFGDLGLIKIMADLAEKGWACFLPVSEHLAVDLIATKRMKNGIDRIIRLQAKYTSSEEIRKVSNNIRYSDSDFDYYAVYMAKLDKVLYVKSDWPTSVIACAHRKGYAGFYWWEDFLKIRSKCPSKKNYCDLGFTPTANMARVQKTKIDWPDDDRLQRLILKHPLTRLSIRLGVSDNAIRRRARLRSLILPQAGYWSLSDGLRDKMRKNYWKKYLNQ